MSGRDASRYGHAIAIANAIEHMHTDVVGGVMPGGPGMKQREGPAVVRLVTRLGRCMAVRDARISVGADAAAGHGGIARPDVLYRRMAAFHHVLNLNAFVIESRENIMGIGAHT